MSTSGPDPTNPVYYDLKDIQPIDVIENWVLPHHLACVVKYFARYRQKGNAIGDLRKAEWYLTRFIALLERLEGEGTSTSSPG